MSEISLGHEITKKDLAKGRNLLIGAWTAPLILSGVPAIIFFALMFILGTTPPVAAVFLFVGLILTAIGLAGGLGLSSYFIYRRSNWTKQMRERIAADGIRADELSWFMNELRSSEKRALKKIESTDLLLADAYRDSLATRLTATRIIRSSKHELILMKRRRTQLKTLHTESATAFDGTLSADIVKIEEIGSEAKVMLAQAETQMQMIEAAAVRGGSISDNELVLKKLSSRVSELPLALEQAKLTDEILREMELEEEEKGE